VSRPKRANFFHKQEHNMHLKIHIIKRLDINSKIFGRCSIFMDSLVS
jgi:hypothetical protein